MPSYIALIHKDKGSDYGVSFPDLLGCVTAGKTVDEAKELAAEALAFHLDGMIEDGEALPEPSSLEAIMKDALSRKAVAFLVSVPEKAEPVVRINITVPATDLKQIDAYAEAHGFTRSGFLVQAARQIIKKRAA